MPTPPMPGAPPPPSVSSAVAIPPQYLQLETSGLSTTIHEGENTFDIAMRSQ
jgi:hypothetical protein